MRVTVSGVCPRSFRYPALSVLTLSRRDRDEVGRGSIIRGLRLFCVCCAPKAHAPLAQNLSVRQSVPLRKRNAIAFHCIINGMDLAPIC
jgi:hypothetical protein